MFDGFLDVLDGMFLMGFVFFPVVFGWVSGIRELELQHLKDFPQVSRAGYQRHVPGEFFQILAALSSSTRKVSF